MSEGLGHNIISIRGMCNMIKFHLHSSVALVHYMQPVRMGTQMLLTYWSKQEQRLTWPPLRLELTKA